MKKKEQPKVKLVEVYSIGTLDEVTNTYPIYYHDGYGTERLTSVNSIDEANRYILVATTDNEQDKQKFKVTTAETSQLRTDLYALLRKLGTAAYKTMVQATVNSATDRH